MSFFHLINQKRLQPFSNWETKDYYDFSCRNLGKTLFRIYLWTGLCRGPGTLFKFSKPELSGLYDNLRNPLDHTSTNVTSVPKVWTDLFPAQKFC